MAKSAFRAARRHLRFFLLNANRDAKHGQRRRALFTLAIRLTPFAAAPQSFPSSRPSAADHKLARSAVAGRPSFLQLGKAQNCATSARLAGGLKLTDT
jgi:hypothetical protein